MDAPPRSAELQESLGRAESPFKVEASVGRTVLLSDSGDSTTILTRSSIAPDNGGQAGRSDEAEERLEANEAYCNRKQERTGAEETGEAVDRTP